VREGEIDNGDGYDMESNDNECANGYVRYDRIPNAIENFAAIKDSKEETNIDRIEKNNMQHVLI
jgi:hypothetical protein